MKFEPPIGGTAAGGPQLGRPAPEHQLVKPASAGDAQDVAAAAAGAAATQAPASAGASDNSAPSGADAP